MALITTEMVIDRYWREVKDKYPNICFDHFSIICKAPFHYIVEQMGKTEIPTILVKYFCKLRVFPVTLRKQLRKCKQLFTDGLLTEEQYQDSKTRLELKLTKAEKTKVKTYRLTDDTEN